MVSDRKSFLIGKVLTTLVVEPLALLAVNDVDEAELSTLLDIILDLDPIGLAKAEAWISKESTYWF